jgi:hypothetical protein
VNKRSELGDELAPAVMTELDNVPKPRDIMTHKISPVQVPNLRPVKGIVPVKSHKTFLTGGFVTNAIVALSGSRSRRVA